MQNNQVVVLPSKEDFGQWKQSSVGRWWFSYIDQMFLNHTQHIIAGGFINLDSAESTALAAVSHSTKANMLYEISRLGYENICSDLGIDLTPKEESEDE